MSIIYTSSYTLLTMRLILTPLSFKSSFLICSDRHAVYRMGWGWGGGWGGGKIPLYEKWYVVFQRDWCCWKRDNIATVSITLLLAEAPSPSFYIFGWQTYIIFCVKHFRGRSQTRRNWNEWKIAKWWIKIIKLYRITWILTFDAGLL